MPCLVQRCVQRYDCVPISSLHLYVVSENPFPCFCQYSVHFCTVLIFMLFVIYIYWTGLFIIFIELFNNSKLAILKYMIYILCRDQFNFLQRTNCIWVIILWIFIQGEIICFPVLYAGCLSPFSLIIISLEWHNYIFIKKISTAFLTISAFAFTSMICMCSGYKLGNNM